MVLSPAQRHSQRIRMQQQLAQQMAVTTSDSLHIQIAELNRDLEALQRFTLRVDKIAHKRDVLLPRWKPTVEAYLASGQAYPNPVFAWCIIWLFDVGDLDTALAWADIAIAQQQATPDRLRSNFPTFVADTVLAWAQESAGRGESVEPYFSATFDRVATSWRLHEQVTAKWFKFAGQQMLRSDDGRVNPASVDSADVLEKADQLLATAEQHYAKIGVGTTRQQVAARRRKLLQP
ncbi:phage terminase small subunit [Cedecea sp.]|jgi:hypothetical protein|uniref:phage terminase small subunit n=1 Tax=Cedecea sp. TaxID=1970739 RepID=UPI002F42AA40